MFGGDTLTATDLAVAAGMAEIGDGDAGRAPGPVAGRRGGLDVSWPTGWPTLVDRMRTSAEPIPVVAVGGGIDARPRRAARAPRRSTGPSTSRWPTRSARRSRRSAARSTASSRVDPGRRDAVLDEARQEAVDRAVAAGAHPDSVSIVDVEEVPLAYLPGNATRIRVKAVGDLSLGGSDA